MGWTLEKGILEPALAAILPAEFHPQSISGHCEGVRDLLLLVAERERDLLQLLVLAYLLCMYIKRWTKGIPLRRIGL